MFLLDRVFAGLAGIALAGIAGLGIGRAQFYPHAFPRKGAAMLFENERAIVWDATWPIGVEQPIHQHKYDMRWYSCATEKSRSRHRRVRSWLRRSKCRGPRIKLAA